MLRTLSISLWRAHRMEKGHLPCCYNPPTSFNTWFTKGRLSPYPSNFLKMPIGMHCRLFPLKVLRIWLCSCHVLHCLWLPDREESSVGPCEREHIVPISPLNLHLPNPRQAHCSQGLSQNSSAVNTKNWQRWQQLSPGFYLDQVEGNTWVYISQVCGLEKELGHCLHILCYYNQANKKPQLPLNSALIEFSFISKKWCIITLLFFAPS